MAHKTVVQERFQRLLTMPITRWANLVALGIYTLLALLFTWPLPLVAGGAIMGDGADAWQETWEMWWMGRAIATAHPPYHFATLYAPDGATNFFHSFNPIEILLTLPVQWAFGPIPAYNVACWMALILTAFGGYLLGRDVTGSKAAGFVAGLALGFAPHQFAQLLGHMDVASIQFFVLGLWCLYRSFGARARRGVVWALWSAACLVASALSHPYSLISAVVVMAFMGVYWFFRADLPTPRWHPAGKSVLALLVGLAIVSPLLLAMLAQRAGPDAPERRGPTSGEIEFYSADLAAYVVPSAFHPLWGVSTERLMRPIKGGAAEKVVFPGFAVLVLGCIGIFSRATRRKALFWVLLGLFGAIMSLGPTLHIGGSNTGITMPGALFYEIPGTSIVRVPARFSLLFLLGLSICAALGAQSLWRRPIFVRYRVAALLAVPMLIGFELLPTPYPVSPSSVKPWYREVAADPTRYGGVLEVPFDRGDSRPLASQTISGLPLAGGYLSRQPVDPLSSGIPPFTDFGLNHFLEVPLFSRPKNTICGPAPHVSTYIDTMRLAKVRYLTLHLDRMAPNDPRIGLAERLFPTPPIYKSDNLIVYDTSGGAAPQDLFGMVEDVEDWGGVEEDKRRWASGKYARFYVWSGAEREANLHFRLSSFAQKRNVAISMGDDLLGAGSVDEMGRAFDVAWRVPKGFSTVLLTVSGPPLSPYALGVGSDQRPLTVSLSECRYSAR